MRKVSINHYVTNVIPNFGNNVIVYKKLQIYNPITHETELFILLIPRHNNMGSRWINTYEVREQTKKVLDYA